MGLRVFHIFIQMDIDEAKVAKKAKKKDWNKVRKIVKKGLPTPLLEEHIYSHKYIRETLFKYSQEVLFHPHIFAQLSWAYPSLVTGQNVSNHVSIWWTSAMVRNARNEMPRLHKMKFLFKVFLHHWRSRHLKTVNTEDIATLEPPKKPVYIVDWQMRTAHVFEAATIMRDITERLMHHDGMFDISSEPRNPYTNNPLTQSQAISLWNQISLSGVPTSTAFSAFRQARWNLSKFNKEYSHMLRLHALRKTMGDPKHIDYIDRMTDFIQYAHDSEYEACDINTYKYALIYYSNHRLLKKWAILCRQFYESSILYSNNAEKLSDVNDIILNSAVLLFNRVRELKIIPVL